MNENKDNRKRYTNALLFGLLLILIFNAVIMPMLNNQPVKDTEYSFFLEQIEDGNVSKVEITDNEVSFQTKDDQKYS
ncbi:MAG TPA: ATP-dependent metallopeptidase FtsH/Yme1/Tma family protein, partial [Ruminococcus flavefaciens]|nr:ATP-dependent metallopeptidase FtsH/Yme1/Tma family protein [Ruminococcus flavefaciens]